jgi:hypothetical protein
VEQLEAGQLRLEGVLHEAVVGVGPALVAGLLEVFAGLDWPRP